VAVVIRDVACASQERLQPDERGKVDFVVRGDGERYLTSNRTTVTQE
jgi:hypothetical protein